MQKELNMIMNVMEGITTPTMNSKVRNAFLNAEAKLLPPLAPK
jgi:hypothetical protein